MANIKPKALLIIDHAPDYRESFLRELSLYFDLTVAAKPCWTENLSPPEKRNGYDYHEPEAYSFLGFLYQKNIIEIARNAESDVVFLDLNLRHLERLVLFWLYPSLKKKTILWGHIFGSNKSPAIKAAKHIMLRKARACLTYNEADARKIKEKTGTAAFPFNNSNTKLSEFNSPISDNYTNECLNCLFVGRFQNRKKLERLIPICKNNKKINVRLIGPGMDSLEIPDNLTGQIETFGKLEGSDLKEHCLWSDCFVNPGHAGLMVMTAARHGKPIIIDRDTEHAPEYFLAYKSNQPFISFSEPAETGNALEHFRLNKKKLYQLGLELQQLARSDFTVENMAKCHFEAFKKLDSS